MIKRLWLTSAALATCLLCVYAQKPIVHKVKEGESMYTIAHKYHLRLPELLQANKIANPHAIKPGMALTVPVKKAAATKKTATAKTTATKAAPASGWVQLNKDRINVRSAPNTNSKRVTIVDKYAKGKALAKSGDWTKIQLTNGRTGWILGKYLSKASAPPAAAKPKAVASRPTSSRAIPGSPSPRTEVASAKGVLSTAHGLKGIRYRYGGSTSRGFDCSGFTSYVYAKYGIRLPHSSAAQAKMGRPVKRSELKPGDLVFFRTRGRGVSHVGIYSGNGQFVHASSARGRVRVDSINSGYYNSRFVTARRVK
ncbi:MAG: C40 family peptidase [Armatimonadetes bacterium]|nr:C40 family peptidase [Armatimonadota bacterium]